MGWNRNKGDKKTMVNSTNDNRYNTYLGMIKRCYNKSNKDYYRYGGKGITVSKEWLDKTKVKVGEYKAGRGGTRPRYTRKGFIQFCEDMGDKPEGKTLDRIDNTKGYSKENCRWATPKEQANNRNDCVKTPTGENLHQYAKRIGIDYRTITKRLNMGWSFDDATTIKVGEKNDRIKYKTKKGETLGMFAKKNGIPRATIYDRIRRGWTVEEAVNTPIGKKR